MLSELEKAILFHRHESNRFRFFGKEYEKAKHEAIADALKRMMDYSERTRDDYKNSLRKRYQR